MKRSIAVTLAYVLYALIASFSAHAADAPHDAASGFTCATCHIAHIALGSTGYNNICMNCHRPGDPAAGINPFTVADAADPFKTHSTAGISKLQQTSHRWDGPDTVPAAGAQAPIQAPMTTAGLRGRSGNALACVRCHSPHYNTYGKFQRIQNDQDQLCLDCHRSRNVQSHLQGSHPVNINYDASATTKPGSFNSPPANANPANPTSDLNAQLTATNRTVLCSTCHGVHYTDSRSSTVDGQANFANLSSGDGNLLHTDPRGAKVAAGQPDKLNICTNCHAGKKSHNIKGQDIQCLDCHAAHVDYDPNDPNNTKGTNIDLIRRYVTKAGQPSQVFFRYTGSQREYVNPQGTGVCQGCHDVPPPGGNYPAQHGSTDPNVCNTCHYHNSSAGSFSGACTACHGYPPTTTAIGGSNGLAAPATNALGSAPASAGAHAAHVSTRGIGCNACHNGYEGKPMPSQTIDIGFAVNASNVIGFVNSVANGTFSGTNSLTGYSWSGANGTTITTAANFNSTCSIYCHGNTLTGGTLTNPSWTGGASQAACGTCHGATAAAPPTTGSHAIHAGAAGPLGMSCDQCHGPHPDNSHVNGSVNWDLTAVGGQYKTPSAASYAATGTTTNLAPSSAYGTCSVKCHGSATPTWGGTLWSTTDQCGMCHSSTASGGVTATTPFYDTSYPVKVTTVTDAKVGAHTSHIAMTDSLATAMNCADCHGAVTLTSGTHMNGTTNFVWSVLAQKGGLAPAYNPATGVCSNVYCHGAAMPGGDTSGTNRAPTWNVPFLTPTISAAACGTCHGFPPAAATGHPAVAIPAGFPTSASIGTTCSCHANINPAGNSYATIFVDKSLHINGTLEVSGGGTCDSCHGYPPAPAGFIGTHNNWSSARTEDYPGGGGAHIILNHVSKLANPGEGFANCNKCHNPADHQMSPISFNPSRNIRVNVNQGYRYEAAKQARYTSNRLDGTAHLTGTCSNISCHMGATPKWDPNH